MPGIQEVGTLYGSVTFSFLLGLACYIRIAVPISDVGSSVQLSADTPRKGGIAMANSHQTVNPTSEKILRTYELQI